MKDQSHFKATKECGPDETEQADRPHRSLYEQRTWQMELMYKLPFLSLLVSAAIWALSIYNPALLMQVANGAHPFTGLVATHTFWTHSGGFMARDEVLSPARLAIDDLVITPYLLLLIAQGIAVAAIVLPNRNIISEYRRYQIGKGVTKRLSLTRGAAWLFIAPSILVIADFTIGGLIPWFVERPADTSEAALFNFLARMFVVFGTAAISLTVGLLAELTRHAEA